MEFALFNVLQQRARDKSSGQVLAEAVEHTRIAEQLGFAAAWFAEHHFSNYSLCPSPLMMLAHCAGVTERIRLGSAVIVPPLYMPARLLGEIAMVDALSGGRLDLGVGSGYQAYEFERFGVDLADNKAMTHEMLDIIEQGLSQPHFSYQGKHYQQQQTAINVRPVQAPHPPIWIAGNDPEFHRRAAVKGYTPFISGVLGSARRLGRLREQVAEAFAAEGRDPETLPLGALRFCHVTHDRKDVEAYAESARYQQRIAVSLRTRRETVVDDYWIAEEPFDEELPLEKIETNLPLGAPETVAERLVEEIRLYRPTQMAIYFQVGDVDSAKAIRSMELLATDVIPAIEKAFGQPLAEINGPVPAAAE